MIAKQAYAKAPRMFSTDSAKAAKAKSFGYLNAIHYLAPFTLAGVGNICPHADGCEVACLGWTSGQSGMVSDVASADAQGNSVRSSRICKTQWLMRDRKGYMRELVKQTEAFLRKAGREGLKPCMRLNGASDIAFEGVACVRNGQTFRNMFEAFPEIQFVDYTKNPARMGRALPANYHLTFSRSAKNEATALAVLASGHNVSVVFADKLPEVWKGFYVINGDKHDLRHLDVRGVVVGLLPKGRVAKKDRSGFVVRSTI
jgi:hypothetical protein